MTFSAEAKSTPLITPAENRTPEEKQTPMPEYDPDIPDEYFETDTPEKISHYLYHLSIPYWVYKKYMFEWSKKTGIPLKEGDLIHIDKFPYIPPKTPHAITPPDTRSSVTGPLSNANYQEWK